MIERTPARPRHVRWVFEQMSDVSRAEFDGLPMADWREFAINHLGKGEGWTYLDPLEGPLFLFGLIPQPKGFRTWFVSAQRYFDLGAKGVRATRHILQGFRDQHPAAEFECCTRSRHPDADRWLRLLGFRAVKDVGHYRVYCLN